VFNTLKISIWGLFSALILFSFSAYSSTLWKEGWTNSTHPTPQLACDKDFQQWSLYNSGTASSLYVEAEYRDSNRYWCRYKFNSNGAIYQSSTVTLVIGSCPSGYVDDGSGQCIVEPACTQGNQLELTHTYDLNPTPSADSVNVNGNANTGHDGCVYAPTNPYVNDDCVMVITFAPESSVKLQCTAQYIVMGDSYTDPSTVVESVDSSANIPYIPTPVSTTTSSPPSTVDTLLDGTTVETKTETKVKDKGDKTKVSQTNPNFIFVQHEDGSTSIESNIITIITDPNGATHINNEQQNTYTAPEITETVVDAQEGIVTTTQSGGDTINSSSTTNNYYDSNGNLTASDSSGTGTGTGTGEDDQTAEGNCGAPDQSSCDVVLEDTIEDSQTAIVSQAEALLT